MQKITPCFWFDNQAEEAAKYYVSVFPNSKMGDITRYGKSGSEVGMTPGAVLTAEFELNGQKFMALNGGPVFKLNEAVSFIIDCKDQKELDYYTEKLSAVPESEQCGWVKDKFGLSWQITPTILDEMIKDKDPVKAERAMEAMLHMKRINIEDLNKAFNG